MIVHNLLNFKDDIRRFSGLDSYSCWTKERAVRRYVRQSGNCKNIECTFASSECRREFIKMRKEKDGQGYDPLCVNEELIGIYMYNVHQYPTIHVGDSIEGKVIIQSFVETRGINT